MRVSIREDEKPFDVPQTTNAVRNFEALFEPCDAAHVNPGVGFVGQRLGDGACGHNNLSNRNVEARTGTRRANEHAVA